MADVNSNININIDASEALATIKALQRQISAFHTSMAKSGAAANAVAANMQQNLLNAVNATNKWQATLKTIPTTTESFTRSLEKNKFSMREYFRYAGASTRTFGKLFKSEFETINKVARERVKDLQTQYIKLGRDAQGAMKAIAIRPLALDMKDYGTQVQIAAQRQQILNQLLKQGSTNLLNFGKNTQWAGRQLMVGFTIPLAYLGTAAGKTFMKLEEQAIRFKRVYGEMFTTGAETNKMLKEIELLAKEFTKYGVSVEKTMEMAATAAASGKMGAELLAQVNEATRLAVLGGVEQEQALETTISLTNAFGLAAEDLAKKINFLNAVENQTVVSIEDLTVAIPKAGPVVEQLGGSVEDLAFFLTAMKEGGINASEGANALKSGLASLINPTDKASKMLGSMGVNIQGIVEANKGNVKGVVIDFAKALDTLDPLNRARAIEQLFGKFQFARLSTLFTNVIAEGNQASRVLKLTQATTEELAILSERELARIEESTTYKFKKTIEDLKVTLAPVGEQFLKALTPIVEFVSKILDKFNNLGDGTKKFITILTVALGGLGPILLMSFGLLANGLANIIKLFASIKGVMNRAGQSSQILGQQTDYMTTEQMQAATVAASLEQVHSKLIQTFTSEASAVAALTTAYKNAVAAQLAFTGPGRVPGKGPKRQTFNRGTTKVKYYSKGTDTVPAMLTPGEAVIPADSAQDPRNKPAIARMVAGGVVGYAGGTVNVGGQGYNLAGGAPATLKAIQIRIDGTLGKVDDILKIALEQLAGETKLTVRKFRDQVRAVAKEKGISREQLGAGFASKHETRERGYSAAKAGERRNVRTQLIEERGAKAAAAELARANAAAKAIEKTLKEYGATTSQIANATQIDRSHMIRVDNEQKKILKVWHSNVWTAQTGAENNAILDSLRKSERYRALYKEYLVKTGATEAQVASIMSNINNGVALTDEQLDIQGRALRRIATDAKTNADLEKRTSRNFIMYSDAVGQAALARAKVLARQPAALRELTVRNQEAMQKIANELPNAAAIALQTKSPSRKMRKVGQDAGAGLVIGAREYVDDAKIAGQQLGAAAVQGTQAQKAAASRAALYGAGPIDATQKSIRRQQEKLARGGATPPPTPPKPTIMQRFRDRQETRRAEGKGMGGGTAMMAASGVMMAASMAPGKVGETAQKLMMPMMALTMLFPLLQSKVGALTVGAGLLVAAFLSTKIAFDKAQDAALKLTEEMGSGTSAMQSLAKFANNVTASEIMSRRRQNALSPFQIQTGKTTFGESFVQSEAGKGMLSNVGQTIKTGGKGAAQSALVNQLASGVMSGAIDTAQARSIAANIAQQLGDYSFGINVNAKLIELLGPNGENALTDPIGIRVKLLQDTRERANLGADAARRAGGRTLGDVKNIGGGALGGAAAGAVTGAVVGSIVPVIGTAIGAGVGAAVGAVAGGLFGSRDRNKRIGEASGASIALQKTALEQQQQMVDSLDLEYQQKIANAKAAGNQAEAERLTNEYIKGRNKLLQENGKLVGDIQKNFDKAEGATRKALMSGVDKAITKQYKGTALEDVAPLAKTMIEDSGVSQEKQFTLKMQLASGQIDPMQMIEIFDTFANDKASIDKVVNIIGKFGGTFANEMMGVVGLFKNKKQAADFVARISTKTAPEAQKELELFQKISQVGQVVDVNVALNYYNKNPKAAAALQKTIDAINEQKGKISLKVATTILGAKEMEVLRANQEYFNSLPPEQQKVYLQTLTTMVNMEGNNKEAIQNWLKANPGKTEGDYYAESAYKVTMASKDTTTKPTTPVSTGDKKGPDPSALDDLTKKLRDVQKNQIKVTTGWSASMAALRKFAGDAKQTALPFSGIEQDLMKLKTTLGKPLVTGNFIDFITGMDPAEYEKRKKQLFKFDNKGNIVGLKKDAKTIQEALNSIVAGEFQSNLKKQKIELDNQTVAYQKLTKMGVPVSEAYELIADASFAAMIATIKNAKKVRELINEYKLFKQLIQEKDEEKAFNINLEQLEKVPTTIANQREAIKKLTDLGVSYGDALAFVQDEEVAAAVAREQNIDTLIRTAEAAKKAADAMKQFGIAQQFAAKMQEFKDTLENFNNQRVAITKLVSVGFSLSEAYNIVQDSAVAATIAQESNNDAIRNAGLLATEATEALKKMAAAQNIVSANQATADTRAILAFLQANRGKFTNDQIKAILENKDLQTLILNPSIDPAALQQALQDAANAANLELELKKLTIEGMEDIFNDGYNKAMEAFDAEEKAITLKFKADTAYLTDPETGIIPIAENAIAQLQYQIDDWEASLKGIEEQEQAINESYDEKFKALDQVQKINEKIARQQKQQLTLADALSRGDISAAAAAIQEMRAQNAADQADNERQLLEASKENRLANVRNALGMTRKQVEEQIKNLQKQIFDIEEKQLEPAREALRLRERQRDIDISNITILGKSKDAWEGIKNGIDLAKTRSDVYIKAMQAALDIAKDIEKYWNELIPNEKKIEVTVTTKYDCEKTPEDCLPPCGTTPKPPSGYSNPCPAAGTIINDSGCVSGKRTITKADGKCGSTVTTESCGYSSPTTPKVETPGGYTGPTTPYVPPTTPYVSPEPVCPPGFVLNSRGSCAPVDDPNQVYGAPIYPVAATNAVTQTNTNTNTNTNTATQPITGVNLGTRPLGVTTTYTAPKTTTSANVDLAPHYLGKTNTTTTTKPTTLTGGDLAPHYLANSNNTTTINNKYTAPQTTLKTTVNANINLGSRPLGSSTTTTTQNTPTTTKNTTTSLVPNLSLVPTPGGLIAIPKLTTNTTSTDPNKDVRILLPNNSTTSVSTLPLPISAGGGGGYSSPTSILGALGGSSTSSKSLETLLQPSSTTSSSTTSGGDYAPHYLGTASGSTSKSGGGGGLYGAMLMMARGGFVKPKYFSKGAFAGRTESTKAWSAIPEFVKGIFAKGTDTIPAMLTPGEFVVSRPAVEEYGIDKMRAINNRQLDDSAVYNYSLNVTLNGSEMDANDVANTVLQRIKQLDSQRIRRQVV